MADGSSVNFAVGAYEDAGPSLLAQQPVTVIKTEEEQSAEWAIAYQFLESRLGSLRNWRYSWWQHWSRLAEFFMPRRYVWLPTANRQWRGQPINDAIIDSTGLMAVRTCAAGMLSGLMSPFRPWFTLEIGLPWMELDAEGKAWLEDTQEKAYTVLDESNFYTVMAQAFQDVTVFGTAPVLIYEDFEDVIRAYLPATGEYYLAAGARLSIDTFYREFTYNIAQIVEFFGVENCPDVVLRLWNDRILDTEMVVAHSIEPNTAFPRKSGGPVQMVPKEFTFREIYWLKGQNTPNPLSVRGFRGDPFMVARWATVSNDAYGRSPCMDALGDNKQVQTETLRKAEVIEKIVRPPMGAPPELKNEPASIMPGQVTYFSTQSGAFGFKPLFQVDAQAIPAITKDIADVNARIEKCLFVDLFMAITRMEGVQPRNELELTQRNQERLQELGPFVKMFQNEFAGPVIRRVLDIMIHRRLLKPLPKSLQNVPLKVNYVSIMRLAQLSLESVAMKDVIAFAGVMDEAAHSNGAKPPSRIIDLDATMRRFAEINNFPSDDLFTVDEVGVNDKQVAKQQQAAAAPGEAMAAVQAAQTMSQTPVVNGGTALDAALGVGARAPTPGPGQI